jgi:hypothetical protein
MTEAPFQELEPTTRLATDGLALVKDGEYALFYFEHAGSVKIKIPGPGFYDADLIDPWLMKIYPLGTVTAGIHSIDIHMVPCLLRFVRAKSSSAAPSRATLHDSMDRFAGELSVPPQSTAFNPPIRHLTTEYTLNVLLLIPAARAALQDILPKLKLDGINPALTLQEIVANPANEISPAKATELSKALAQIPQD